MAPKAVEDVAVVMQTELEHDVCLNCGKPIAKVPCGHDHKTLWWEWKHYMEPRIVRNWIMPTREMWTKCDGFKPPKATPGGQQ